MSRRPTDVAIIGLGPTGATLANLCGRAGLRTVVYERSTAPYSQPRACHLDAEIARVFQGLGLEADLHRLLTVQRGMDYVDRDGNRLFTFEGFEREPLLGWHEDYVFVQPQLEAVLRTSLDWYPHVDVRVGTEAPPLDELLASATWVVACDGARSDTREALGIRFRDLLYHQTWQVLDVVLRDVGTPPLPTVIHQICDPERLATYVPSHGKYRRWEFQLEDDEELDAWAVLARWGRARGQCHAGAQRPLPVPRARRGAVARRTRGTCLPRRRRRAHDAAVHGTGHVQRHPRRGEPRLEAG